MPEFLTECIVVARRGLGEDCAAVVSNDGVTALVLADGAGGRVGGRQAAELSTSMTLERLRPTGDVDPLAVLEKADRFVHADRQAGETTLVLARIVGAALRGASVGDSGAWLIGASAFQDLTADQTRKPMLGSGAARGASFSASLTSETLLIASDGLLKFAPAETICSIVRGNSNLATAGRALVDSVRLRSGDLQDDVSVVLLRRR